MVSVYALILKDFVLPTENPNDELILYLEINDDDPNNELISQLNNKLKGRVKIFPFSKSTVDANGAVICHLKDKTALNVSFSIAELQINNQIKVNMGYYWGRSAAGSDTYILKKKNGIFQIIERIEDYRM